MPLDIQRAREFWHWFQGTEDRIVAAVESSDYDWLRRELGSRVARLHPPDIRPRINWEIGPGRERDWQFVLSPVVKENLPLTEGVVREAPDLPRWEWYACKPPKPDQLYRLKMVDDQGKAIRVDAETWEYLLKKYPDSDLLGIMLLADNLPEMDTVERIRTAHLLLDNILGERVVLDRFREVHLFPADAVPSSLPTSRLVALREHLESLQRGGPSPQQ